jgi:hypothetical protein
MWAAMIACCAIPIAISLSVGDGLLLFFPPNWAIRFHSPISYWAVNHYGRQFQQFELALNAALLIYLLKTQACRFLRRFPLFDAARS